jgi:hypothetical protein
MTAEEAKGLRVGDTVSVGDLTVAVEEIKAQRRYVFLYSV